MKRVTFLILSILIFSGLQVYSQRSCGMSGASDVNPPTSGKRISNDVRLNKVEGVVTIPVVVHVIHNVQDGQIKGMNISDEQIKSQIDILNQDFRRKVNTPGYNDHGNGADTEIEFCLAGFDPSGNLTNGIQRIYTQKNYWLQSEIPELKKMSYWPSDKYLNIWVTNLSSIMGISQYPEDDSLQGLRGPYEAETDGVVIDYPDFGNTGEVEPPYDKGRTATHEIGHWLGLKHLWGDFICGTDFIDDTPQDKQGTETGVCSDSSDCDGDGNFSADMSANYMDYSDDQCMNIFTEGQKKRMRAVLSRNPRRNSLLSSHGCSVTSSVQTNFHEEDLQIFPDPAADNEVNVRFVNPSFCNISIINETNQIVLTKEFGETEIAHIDISSLAAGIYFIVIREKDKTRVHKFFRV